MKHAPSQFEVIYTMAAAVLMMLALSGFVVYFIFASQRRKLRQMREQEKMKASYEQEVLTTQIESRDQTLRDVSQEIHDNMGQLLSVARINLNILEKELPDHPQTKRIKDTNSILGDVIRYIRMLSKGLNSDILSSYGLRESIRFELQRIEQAAFLKVHFMTDGDDFVIDNKKEIVIYRMILEILNNIIKHAAATEISVAMLYTDKDFSIRIKDNGIGFDKQETEQRSIGESGSGLKNLDKRASMVGAKLTINSVPGEGTHILITLPKNVTHDQ